MTSLTINYVSMIPEVLSLNAKDNQKKGRKTFLRKLSTGHRFIVTPQEEKTLKHVYAYMSGFTKRKHMESLVSKKRSQIMELGHIISPSGTKNMSIMLDDEVIHAAKTRKSKIDLNKDDDGGNLELEQQIDQYFKYKEELMVLEKKLKDFNLSANDHKITFKDIDNISKSLGVAFSKRQIEQMIWEIDEDLDEMISWDEFQLTYYRNVQSEDPPAEPCAFFRLMEFMIFDESHKGHILEDDCMEALFARLGSGKLESELKLIFGNNLRASGGDGTLSLQGYLDAMQKRDGKRALIGVL